MPKSAPFFIPTVPGLVPRYAAPEQNNDPQQVKYILGHCKYIGCGGCLYIDSSLPRHSFIHMEYINDRF